MVHQTPVLASQIVIILSMLEESILTIVDEYSSSGISAQEISDNYIIIIDI
jgi:hypothetical protein